MTPNTRLPSPVTATPVTIVATLVVMFGVIALLLLPLIGVYGLFLSMVAFGFAIMTGLIAVDVPALHAIVLLNSFTGIERAVFQGFHFKLPWEFARAKFDLRPSTKEVRDKYPSADALMEVTYVFTIAPDLSTDAPSRLITYSSFKLEDVARRCRALLSQLLSDHFSKHHGDELLDKAKIVRETFDEGPGAEAIAAFRRQHAIELSVELERSEFVGAAQRFRDMVSGAKSFADAVEKLLERGVSRSEAERVAKLMNLDGAKEYFVHLEGR